MKFLDKLSNSLSQMWYSIAEIGPKIILAILGVIIALIVIRIILSILKRVLKAAKLERIDEKINEIELVEGKHLNVNLLTVILKTVKWILYVVLFMAITELLQLKMLSDGLKSIIGYLPQILTALAIFVVGLLFANFVKTSLKSLFDSMNLSGGKAFSPVSYTHLTLPTKA